MIEKLGFVTHQVNHNTWCLTSPQTFSSGRPVSFYLHDYSDYYFLDDYGLNFHYFYDCLHNPDNAKQAYARLIKNSPVNLNGHRLTYSCSKDCLDVAIGEYINAIGSIVSYEHKPQQSQQIDEVLWKIEKYLLGHYEGDLIHNPSVKGLSGKTHHFRYKTPFHFVDYVQPNAQNTGKMLRKMIDVQNIDENAKFLIVLDNKNERLYGAEVGILSTIANVIPTSNLTTS